MFYAAKIRKIVENKYDLKPIFTRPYVKICEIFIVFYFSSLSFFIILNKSNTFETVVLN